MSPQSNIPTAPNAARRTFFKILGAAGSGAATALVGAKALEMTARRLEASPALPEAPGSAMLRMQQDLDESLRSGRTPAWMMLVDTRKCVGCNACTVACRAENPTGPAGNFRRVIEVSSHTFGAPSAIYKPANCLQCDNPPCANVVPEGMIRKQPDGIVVFDQEKLKGPHARAAAAACPFRAAHVDDARTFTQFTPAPQSYEERTFVENGKLWNRKGGRSPLAETARKCNFCEHLLETGVLPACVTTCLGGAMYFGDANNRNSLVSQMSKDRRIFRGHENMGVKPRVLYYEEPVPEVRQTDCAACHY